MTRKKKIRYAAVFLLGFLAAAALDTHLSVKNYTVRSEKIKDSLIIAQISDLHNFRYGKEQSELISAVRSTDIIVLTGDIIDDRSGERENVSALLKRIVKIAPCFYVTGNHEIYTGKANEIKAYVSSFGVKVLDGLCETLGIKGNSVNICGVDDQNIGMQEFTSQIQRAAEKTDFSDFSVLLVHRPEYIKSYLEYGYDLFLCGHDHGGQAALPFLLNGLVSPETGFFPEYAGGEYFFGRREMIVSRGLSLSLPRMFNRPEVVLITVCGEQLPQCG